MVLTIEEAVRQHVERQRILGDLDGLTPGQTLDRYIEAAEWTAAQPCANRVDYLGGVATGLAHAISLIGKSRAEYTILVAIAEDAVRTVICARGEE